LPIRIDSANKSFLESLFNNSARGVSEPLSYYEQRTSAVLPVSFAEPVLPVFVERGPGQFSTTLSLREETNYPQLALPGSGPAYSGNRFILGTVKMRIPIPLRSGYGNDIERLQSRHIDSLAAPMVYEKSRIYRRHFNYPAILTTFQFTELKTFFFSYTHGQEKTFAWSNQNNAAITVRLGSNKITVKQLGYNRYAVDLPLVEEVAL
jgi:hypothetical protein